MSGCLRNCRPDNPVYAIRAATVINGIAFRYGCKLNMGISKPNFRKKAVR
jgi:hypothetical protein